MTDQRQPSPIDLFRPSALSSKPAVSSFSGRESETNSRTSFSRELSRASDSSTPQHAVDTRHTRDTAKPSDHVDGSSSKERHSQSTSGTEDSSRSSSSDTDEAKSSKVDDVGDRTNSRSQTGASQGDRSSMADDSKENSAQAGDQDIADKAKNTEDLAAATNNAVGRESGLLPVDPDIGESTLISVSEIDANSGEALVLQAESDELTSDDIVNPVAVDVKTVSTQNETESAVNSSANTTEVRLLMRGDNLSSVELANRQVQLAQNIDVKELNPGMVASLASKVPLESGERPVRLVDTVTLLSQRMNSRVGLQGVGLSPDVAISDDESAKLTVSPLLNAKPQEDGALNKLIQQTEVQLKADADAKLMAQNAEKQAVKANIAQLHQLTTQQTHNATMTNVNVAVDTNTSGATVPDNMFHSVGGGIVTAATPARVDSVNTQIINAPQTISILQNDADKALAGNIRWMAKEGVKNAVMNVTPSGMGPISVTIGMEKDQMNISIVALQGSTREALDSMLPRLREQLLSQGHEGVKVDISDGRKEQSDRGYGQEFSGNGNDDGQNAESTKAGIFNAVDDVDSTNENEDQMVNQLDISSVRNGVQIRSSYDVYV